MKSIDQVFEKIDQIKNEDTTGEGISRSRSGFASMIIGGICGLMIGYSKKWNLFYSAIGGSVLGGVVGTVLVPKK